MSYKTIRYEKSDTQLFIRIESGETPLYVEHFFTDDEMASDQTIIDAIAWQVATLRDMDNEYAPTPYFVCNKSKLPAKEIVDTAVSKLPKILPKPLPQDAIADPQDDLADKSLKT